MASTSVAPATFEIPGIQLGSELGRGAHSVVYAAKHGDQSLAVKIALQSDFSTSKRDRQRFLREATLLASSRHPTFAKIYEIGDISGRAYLVMERVDGHTLAEHLQDHSLSTSELRAHAINIARGLAAIHRRGLVHRDIKPRNIVIDLNARARLIDFGLVAQRGQRVSNEIGGTFLYSAPEQTGLLKRPVDGRADLYALGVVLYECISGVPPFRAADPGELMRMHAVEPPRRLEKEAPRADPVLSAITHRLLSKDPDDRYQTAEGLIADLERLDELRHELDDRSELLLGREDYEYGVLRETPMTGREPELRLLKRAWREAVSGFGCATTIQGATGTGKTRLMHEVISFVRESGGLVLLAQIEKGREQPFAAIHSAIDCLLDHYQRLPSEAGRTLQQLMVEAAQGSEAILSSASPRLRTTLGLTDGEATADPTLGDHYEGFTSFLIRLARSAGGTALFIDDADEIDEPSLRVLSRVSKRIAELPFLLVATLGNTEHSIQRTDSWLGELPVTRISTSPLDLGTVEQLLSNYLGARVPHELVQQMMIRTEGSPLLLSEYLRAMLEAGMLIPHWGKWMIDVDRLAEIELSPSIVELVKQRIGQLDPEAVVVLRSAAIFGTRFELKMVTEVSGSDEETTNWAIAEALRARLIERDMRGRYAFIHRQVPDALLEETGLEAQQELHRRAAAALDGPGSRDGDIVYRQARHEFLGAGPQVFETSLRAGEQALGEHAFAQAYTFLIRALEARPSEAASNRELLHALGIASSRAGRTHEAIEFLNRAVTLTSDRIQLAQLHAMLAQVHLWDSFHTRPALEEVERGFRALGIRLSTGRARMVVGSVVALLRGWWVRMTGIGAGTAQGVERDRLMAVSQLLKLAGQAQYWMMQPGQMALVLARIVYPSVRLGPGAEFVHGMSAIALALTVHRCHSWAERLLRECVRVSKQLENKGLEAYSKMVRAISLNLRGHVLQSEHEMKETLVELGGWLDQREYTQGVADLVWQLQLRGYTSEAQRWVEQGLSVVRLKEHQPGQIFLLTRAAACFVSRGLAERGQEYLADAERLANAAPEDRYRKADYLIHFAFFQFEQGRLEEAEDTLLEFQSLEVIPQRLPFHMRSVYVFQGYVRLRAADRRACPTQALDESIKELESVARDRHPIFQSHLLVIRAGRSRLSGDFDVALDCLDQADRLAHTHDAPWPEFEARFERALLLREQSHLATADRLARDAYEQAIENGWTFRAQRVRRAFSHLARSTSVIRDRGVDTLDEQLSARAVQLQRHVDALIQVSQVSLSVNGPEQQARAILDEVVSLFGAERAFLFLSSSDQEEDLRLFAARDSLRTDLREASEYSTTVIERVLAQRSPVVVSGNEDAIAIGSESAIALQLRSIIAAPLQLRDRLVGIVYLDNRHAKGVFTSGDAETLTAVSSHIAMAIETSRTAELEIEYQSEREKRHLAEALRTLTDQGAPISHDTEIISRLLDSVMRFVPSVRADCYVRREGHWKWTACKLNGFATRLVASGEGDPVEKTELLARVRETGEPHLVRTTADGQVDLIPHLAGTTRSWIALPMFGIDSVNAVLAFSSNDRLGLDDGKIELAETFASQAGIAIDNIHLFNRVQQLATIDELTRVSNRRSVFEFGRSEFRRARRYNQPLAIVMLDVDHFKRVNDTHGHAVGDHVLQELAQRCSYCARDVDKLGRYGGEEFVLIAPLTTADAASRLAERMRLAVSQRPFKTPVGELEVTVSLGVAELVDSDVTVDRVFERADRALYAAKDAGRNCVSSAPAHSAERAG